VRIILGNFCTNLLQKTVECVQMSNEISLGILFTYNMIFSPTDKIAVTIANHNTVGQCCQFQSKFSPLYICIVVFCVKEHLDYDIVQSTNPEFRKAIVRVNIYRDHRQTVQVKPRFIPSSLQSYFIMMLK